MKKSGLTVLACLVCAALFALGCEPITLEGTYRYEEFSKPHDEYGTSFAEGDLSFELSEYVLVTEEYDPDPSGVYQANEDGSISFDDKEEIFEGLWTESHDLIVTPGMLSIAGDVGLAWALKEPEPRPRVVVGTYEVSALRFTIGINAEQVDILSGSIEFNHMHRTFSSWITDESGQVYSDIGLYDTSDDDGSIEWTDASLGVTFYGEIDGNDTYILANSADEAGIQRYVLYAARASQGGHQCDGFYNMIGLEMDREGAYSLAVTGTLQMGPFVVETPTPWEPGNEELYLRDWNYWVSMDYEGEPMEFGGWAWSSGATIHFERDDGHRSLGLMPNANNEVMVLTNFGMQDSPASFIFALRVPSESPKKAGGAE